MNEKIDLNAKNKEFNKYLSPTYFIDCDNQDIIDYAYSIIRKDSSEIEKAISLYYAVRDDILYDPYHISLDSEKLKASYILKSKRGFCVSKAVLLAAVTRAVGIPSRLGFADVKNHLTTEGLRKIMRTDIFTYHGYTELFLNNRWVKATPAFNRSLCKRFNIKPLEFDGVNDSIFHAYDTKGDKHMEYVRDYGQYSDLPLNDMVESFKKHYPHIMEKYFSEIKDNFEDEAKPI